LGKQRPKKNRTGILREKRKDRNPFLGTASSAGSRGKGWLGKGSYAAGPTSKNFRKWEGSSKKKNESSSERILKKLTGSGVRLKGGSKGKKGGSTGPSGHLRIWAG